MPKSIPILISIVLAVMLAMIPLSTWAEWLRPSWVLLILIYWAMVQPNRLSVITAWVVGLLMDFAMGTALGEHALGYTIIVYFVSKLYLRLRMYPLLQQALSILCFVFLYEFVIYCIQGFQGNRVDAYWFWLPSITSMLVWPWFFLLMQSYRKRFAIH